MNATVLSKENNVVKFTFQAGPEKFEEGLKYSYNRNKYAISIPGFRKGKAPRKLIEAEYGKEIFWDDAINFVLNDMYEDVVKELGLEVVSKPDVDAKEVSTENGISFEVSVTVKPEVTLGQYKGLEVEKADIEVKEEEIDAELKKVQEQNARTISVSDRPAQMGDIVNISYLGTVDGVPFEGGQSDGYDLTLGSKSFIDTFEDQIVGHNIGDKFDVNVTFPAEYHSEDLAGKNAVFAVELKDISTKELPELNDEFAQDVSEYESLDEYKKNILSRLKEAKENAAKNAKIETLIAKAVENAKMDVPQVMIDNRAEQMVKEFENNITRQGIAFDLYCQYMNTTPQDIAKTFEPTAEKNVKSRLVLEQVVKDEGIIPTEEEIEEQIGKIAEGIGMSKEQLSDAITENDRSAVALDLAVQKAIDLLEETAVEVDPIPVKVDAAPAE